MLIAQKKKSPWLKRLLLAGLVMLLGGAAAVWYIFNEKFADTNEQKAAAVVTATDLLNEFRQGDSVANKKYAEKILVVNGRVTATEAADTTINIKMEDTLTGSYIIFAFQQQSLAEARQVKAGDSISIKGSCSGGTYSDILEAEFVTFKRCTLNK